MQLKRILLRYKLIAQKYWIKGKNIGIKDLYGLYLLATGRLPHIIHLREMVFAGLIFSVVVFFMFLSSFRELNGYYLRTEPKNGGIYTEGIVGKFLRLNPIYSKTNPSDEDAVNLIFSGLMKRGEDGKLTGDTAQKWETKDAGMTFVFTIKDGIKWHDGKDFSVDDIFFTLNLIQNPDVRSPLYETWKGVKAEKEGDRGIKFTLAEPNLSFIENATFKILPKHILENTPASNIQTAEFNIKPVGTGPYKFESLNEESDKEVLVLDVNNDYYDSKPYIERIVLEAYLNEKDILSAYERRNVKAISNPSSSLVSQLADESTTTLHRYRLPRYVAMFFNTEREELKNRDFRTALGLAVDRDKILSEAVLGRGSVAFYPIDNDLEGSSFKVIKHSRNPDKAKEILKKAGYTDKNGTLTNKENEISLNIITGNTSELRKTAEVIKQNFQELGVKTEIKSLDQLSLERDYIRPRDYDILIFGENLGNSSDFFSLWHSSQANDPGLNFSKFKDRELDKYLETLSFIDDQKERAERLERIQNIIIENSAAVYLYNPFYYLVASEKVGGIGDSKISDPSERFHNVENWYVNAKQVIIDN